MIRAQWLGLSICTALLAACAGGVRHAIKDPQSTAHILQCHASTRSDVSLALGSAKVNKFDSGFEVWAYRYQGGALSLQGFKSRPNLRELVILFDPSGVLKKYRWYEGPDEQ
jgi:hypothetical protein